MAGAESALPRWPYGTDPVWRAAADLPGGEPAIAARMKSDAPLRDPYAPAMLPVVAHLTPDDIVDLCAYLGSLQPK